MSFWQSSTIVNRYKRSVLILLTLFCLIPLGRFYLDIIRFPYKAYYYPLDELATDDKVYVYTSSMTGEQGKHPDEVWRYHLARQHGQSYLYAKSYAPDHRLNQFQKEHIVKNGSIVEALSLYEYGPGHPPIAIQADIAYGNHFIWEDHKDKILFYKISFTDIGTPDAHTSLIRNIYTPTKTKVRFDGKWQDAIIIKSKELISSFEDGYIEMEMLTEEVYIKGIGKVSYEKKIDGQTVLSYSLKEILSPMAYELKYGPLLDPKLSDISS